MFQGVHHAPLQLSMLGTGLTEGSIPSNVPACPSAGSIPQQIPQAPPGYVPIEMMKQLWDYATNTANAMNPGLLFAGGGGPSTSAIAQQQTGDIAPQHARVLPMLSAHSSVKAVIRFLKDPPLGETGLSIIDREWQWREAGLQAQDISWRKGHKDAKKRIFEYKRIYEKVLAVKQELNSGMMRMAGGGATDLEAAEFIDRVERNAGKPDEMPVATYIKRQIALAARAAKAAKAAKASGSEEVEETGAEEGSEI